MKRRKLLCLVGSLVVIALGATITGCTTSSERQQQYKSEGLEALNKGQYAEAVELFNEALEMSEGTVSDNEIDICYCKAAAQFNANDKEGAIKTYTALIDYDKDNPYPYFLRGSVYLKSGEKGPAFDDYKDAIKIDEKNYDLYIAIYENLKAMNFEKEGEEFLNIALEKSGDSAEDCLARGRIYTLMKQYDAARTAFEKADDKNAEDAKIYLANLYLEEGNEAKCDEILESVKKDDNPSAMACNAIATMELKRNNPNEALIYVNKGLDKIIKKNRRDLLKNRIAATEKLGQFNEAYQYAVEYLEEYPQDVDVVRELEFLSSRIV